MHPRGIVWAGTRTGSYSAMTTFARDVLELRVVEETDGMTVYELADGDHFEVFDAGGPHGEPYFDSEWEGADELIKELLRSYSQTLAHHHHPLEEYRYVHAARKVVGVGSVGTRCYILLLLGRDDDDPLFLQAKEAQPSVLEPYLAPSQYSHHGERVVAGQRLMQCGSDIFLGWQRIPGLDGVTRDYYLRQLHDWKGSVDVDTLLVPGATVYARFCGAALARAHARWGDRIAIASYLGNGDVFDRAIADFAARYADQNELDYATFMHAIDSGRLAAQPGL